MLPPDEQSPYDDPEPYDLPRGTCVACGSDEVVHLAIGMPASPEAWDSGPEWLTWVGCCHPGHDRECRSCGATWTAARATMG